MTVTACLPLRNSATWLPKNIPILESFDDVTKVVISYDTETTDNTLDYVKKWKENSKKNIEVYARPKPPYQVHSSAEIAYVYRDFANIVKDSDESHLLLWDHDVIDAPKSMVKRLLKHDKDIIAPYPYIKYHQPFKQFYDTHVYRKSGYRFHPYNPPYNDGKPFQVDSVGTAFLVKKEVFMATPYDDPYPHMLFCNQSREKGYEVWVDPEIEIWHVDLTRLNEYHYMVEQIPTSRHYNPSFRPPDMITDSGRIVTGEELYRDMVKLYVYGRKIKD